MTSDRQAKGPPTPREYVRLALGPGVSFMALPVLLRWAAHHDLHYHTHFAGPGDAVVQSGTGWFATLGLVASIPCFVAALPRDATSPELCVWLLA